MAYLHGKTKKTSMARTRNVVKRYTIIVLELRLTFRVGAVSIKHSHAPAGPSIFLKSLARFSDSTSPLLTRPSGVNP